MFSFYDDIVLLPRKSECDKMQEHIISQDMDNFHRTVYIIRNINSCMPQQVNHKK